MKKIIVLSMIIVMAITAWLPFERHTVLGGAKGASSLYGKTFNDVLLFLFNDNTHLNKWNKYTFNCVQFSEEMVDHAQAQGFHATTVEITWTYPDRDGFEAHDIVAIYSVDQGMIWIEPQTNVLYRIPDENSSHNLSDFQPLKLCHKDDVFCWPYIIDHYNYFANIFPN